MNLIKETNIIKRADRNVLEAVLDEKYALFSSYFRGVHNF